MDSQELVKELTEHYYETKESGFAASPLNEDSKTITIDKSVLFQAFKEAHDLLESHAETIAQKIREIADDTKSLDKAVNYASICLGSSLILFDRDITLISTSTSIPVTDPVWKDTMERGYCSYELKEAVKKLDCIEKLNNGYDIVEITDSTSSKKRIATNIMLDHQQIGYLLMVASEAPLERFHYRAMQEITEAIIYAVSKYGRQFFPSLDRNSICLQRLLSGITCNELATELTNNPLPIFSSMVLLSIEPTAKQDACKLPHITLRLHALFLDSIITTHNNSIVSIIPMRERVELTEVEIGLLSELAKETNTRIGVSFAFFDYQNILYFYNQARSSIVLTDKLGMHSIVATYRDYAPYDFLNQFSQKDVIPFFKHPLLERLQKFDHDKGTSLYQTLKVFTEYNCNIKIAAEKLYIHRNTLIHRLEKIRDLGHLDINEPENVLLLRMSYGIDWFLDNYKDCL